MRTRTIEPGQKAFHHTRERNPLPALFPSRAHLLPFLWFSLLPTQRTFPAIPLPLPPNRPR